MHPALHLPRKTAGTTEVPKTSRSRGSPEEPGARTLSTQVPILPTAPSHSQCYAARFARCGTFRSGPGDS
jgi:hypothetical protein